MKKRHYRTFVGDFETTVFSGQTSTEVWASACVELYTEDVKVFTSIDELFDYFVSLNDNIICYFHNLKFDGAFWLDYLLNKLKFTQAKEQNSDAEYDISFVRDNDMKNNSFKYLVSTMGQWYTMTIKVKGHYIEIRDSLKLLPFSVRAIGKSFKTKHQKLEIEYTGERHAFGTITEEEKSYIANDVLVIKEALEIMFDEGHTSLTIGSCCLNEFKSGYNWEVYKQTFPDLYEIPLDVTKYGSENVGQYIRNSYRGGWCYVVKGKENRMFYNGTTADVNSLYPSMMSSESGNRYPIGEPYFWKGNYIPEEALGDNRYYFIRIRTRFKIKEGYLPFIQLKRNSMYVGSDNLETSDLYDKRTGKYYDSYIDSDGIIKKAYVTMTLTMTDYQLMQEHYDLIDCTILDGCWFFTLNYIFDKYINKYKEIKINSKGAKRELAKLFLNNLYGKMATSKDSSFKYAYTREDGVISFASILEQKKKAGYIPIGSAITSYARNFTIRTAQKNYYGVDKRGFIYADTDSIHCDLLPHELKGIVVHPTNFCCWKLESCWDKGWFVRAKTYIEHITHENLEPVEPRYNIRCAGLPERCKELYIRAMEDNVITNEDIKEGRYNKEEQDFTLHHRDMEDFTIGLVIPSKLMAKRIKGGIVLMSTNYEMR